jgi:hypothetical protein
MKAKFLYKFFSSSFSLLTHQNEGKKYQIIDLNWVFQALDPHEGQEFLEQKK